MAACDLCGPSDQNDRRIGTWLMSSLLDRVRGLCWIFFLVSISFPSEASPQNCTSCHQEQTKAWEDSHHRHAMHPAREETVLGDFRAGKVKDGNYEARFSQSGNSFWIHLENEKGNVQGYEVIYTFGWHPLQQYLVQVERSPGKGVGKLQSLPWAWDILQQRWFHLFRSEKPKPGESIHWTGWAQNWNHMCADCHVTKFDKGFDPEKKTFNSTFTYDHVHCTACHEPHEMKVAKPEKKKQTLPIHLDFDRQRQKRELDSCAPCHSLREQIASGKAPKDAFQDHYDLVLPHTNQYHVDGQIKGEVYVMGSFLQSKMHAAGVRCSHCHDPHSLKLRKPGRQVCLQCHEPKIYASSSHHRHKEGGGGSNCLECHMPESVYMGIDRRRDHSFGIPRPDLSLEYGTPNACAGCHLQEGRVTQHGDYQKWLAEGSRKEEITQLTREMTKAYMDWFETTRPSLRETLSRFRAGDDSQVLELMSKGQLPEIWVATLLAEGWSPDHRLLRNLGERVRANLPIQDIQELYQRLKDPVRSVRLRALRTALGLKDRLTESQKARVMSPLIREDVDGMLRANADQSQVHQLVAEVFELRGRRTEAIKHLKLAIEVQPDIAGARATLSGLVKDENRSRELLADEIELLRSQIKFLPEEASLHYSLGLLYYRSGKYELCVATMRKVLELRPGDYNAGAFVIQLLQQRGRLTEARSVALELVKYHPRDPWLMSVLRGR